MTSEIGGAAATSSAREFWFLDDGRAFGGGQMNALRLGRYIDSGSAPLKFRLFCPRASELARRGLDAGLRLDDAGFPDGRPGELLRIARSLADLRRTLAAADARVIVVGGSLRVQTYAHVAVVGLRNRPTIVQFMTERDSAARRSGRFLLRRFGGVVAVGGNAAAAYQDALPDTRVIGVNNFLLPDELIGGELPRPNLGGRPVIGVLARLIPEKGIVELLDELAAAQSSWVRLLIGGHEDDPSYAGLARERIASLGLGDRVTLLGHVDDLDEFMAACDAIVVPSVGREGQPTVILDALARDRPVIVREHVWSDDFEGLPVFPYRDASDLPGRLDSVAETHVNLAELQGRFGPQQVLDAFEAAAEDVRGRRG
jgi:glycosyltransferase involved in cell wall biosynthesis